MTIIASNPHPSQLTDIDTRLEILALAMPERGDITIFLVGPDSGIIAEGASLQEIESELGTFEMETLIITEGEDAIAEIELDHHGPCWDMVTRFYGALDMEDATRLMTQLEQNAR